MFALKKGAIPIPVPVQRRAALRIFCRPIDLRCLFLALESFVAASYSQILCRRLHSGISYLTVRPSPVPDARISPYTCRFLFSCCSPDPELTRNSTQLQFRSRNSGHWLQIPVIRRNSFLLESFRSWPSFP